MSAIQLSFLSLLESVPSDEDFSILKKIIFKHVSLNVSWKECSIRGFSFFYLCFSPGYFSFYSVNDGCIHVSCVSKQECVKNLNVTDEEKADQHYRAVCGVYVTECIDLITFLEKVGRGKKELKSTGLEDERDSSVFEHSTDWVSKVHSAARATSKVSIFKAIVLLCRNGCGCKW